MQKTVNLAKQRPLIRQLYANRNIQRRQQPSVEICEHVQKEDGYYP